MHPPVMPVVVFLLCYVLFVALPKWRSVVACGGGLALVLTGALPWHDALTELIQWNVIALFFGTLILAELFLMSRMPAVIAERLVDRAKTMRGAMLVVCALSGFISMFIENVAVVLLVAPIALSLAEKLKISPVRLLILIAMASNLQGTATLIGDPPSMILAGYMKFTFNDFFFYRGKPGIFFAVQIGALAALAVSAILLRQHKERIETIRVEKVRAWTPTILLLVLVIGLSTTSVFDPDFRWMAGTLTMILAISGLIWFKVFAKWGSTRCLIRTLDWDTTFFLIGVFVVVGGLSESGWLDKLAEVLSGLAGGNLWLSFLAIIAISVSVSAFVDNVPFLLAMIPVTQKIADTLGAPAPLLMFALLIGSCLGGNITPIGASANVVAIGMLKKKGHLVSFREFMGAGIPYTVAAVAAAAVFVWLVWAP
jgi:Na+/H+ antiporter NhaD/arsenite permease-like protein